ncbi:hypothetical protein Tco_1537828 [Tanacetum coccineum]
MAYPPVGYDVSNFLPRYSVLISVVKTTYPVLPNDTVYFANSIRCTDPQQIDTAYRPPDTEVILFYNGLDVPTRQILDSKGAIPTKTAANAKVAIQEMTEHSQKWYNGTSRTRSTETSDGLAAIQA